MMEYNKEHFENVTCDMCNFLLSQMKLSKEEDILRMLEMASLTSLISLLVIGFFISLSPSFVALVRLETPLCPLRRIVYQSSVCVAIGGMKKS